MLGLKDAVFELPIEKINTDLQDTIINLKRQDYVILRADESERWNRLKFFILNLLHKFSWNTLVIISLLVNFFSGTTCFYFFRSFLTTFIPIYITCDLIFLFNLILVLVHNFWKSLQVQMSVVKTLWIFYVVDIISLLPQELILIAIFGEDSIPVVYCRWVTYIRFVHLIPFVLSFDKVFDRRKELFFASFVVLIVTIHHFGTCLLYAASCHHRRCQKFHGEKHDFFPEANNFTIVNADLDIRRALVGADWYDGRWSENLLHRYPYYKDATIWEWYMVCSYAMLEIFSTLGAGNISGKNIYEILCFGLVMSLGFLVFNLWFMVYFYQMISLRRVNKTRYFFKIKGIKMYLRDVNIEKDVEANIKEYFEILWEKKEGVKSAAHFSSLPSPLQLELMFDLNGTHLRRSLLFYDLKENYLRAISMFVKHEFLLPGDSLYHQGVVKNNVVIITRGILEILSDEDNESPIIAFKAGTVLGETSLFLSLPAKATLRAAVYSEVKLIDRVEFIRNISKYPLAFSYLRDRIMYRIRFARRIKEESKGQENDQHTHIPIKDLKDRLIKRHKRAALRHQRGLPSALDSKSTLNILDLYQLSNENSNIELPVVCLTYKFPWIIDSRSSLNRLWEFIVISVHTIFLLLYAYEVVFLRELDAYVKFFLFASDVVCIVDVTLFTMLSVVLKDRELTTFKEIVRYRMKSVDFYLNAIPVLPYEYFLIVEGMDDNTYRRISDLIMSIKFLRLRRCYKIFQSNWSYDISHNKLGVSIARHLIYFVMISYMAGCLIYFHSCIAEVCNENSWYFVMMRQAVEGKEEDPCYLYPFATSLYFSGSLWLRAGFGDIIAVLPYDMPMVFIYVIVGFLLVVHMISSLAVNMSTANASAENFERDVFSFGRFLENYKIPREMHLQVKKYFTLQWLYDRATGRSDFRNVMPQHLRIVVYKTELMDLISQIPLFQLVDVDYLMKIILSVQMRIIPEGETICYAGDVDREMFIIQKGNCEVFNVRGHYERSLKAGDYFGVVEMIFNMSKSFTVKTTTNCKIVHLSFRAFMSALSMFPGEMRISNLVIKDRQFLERAELLEQRRMIAFLDRKSTRKRKSTALRIKTRKYLELFGHSFIPVWNCYKTTGGREKYWAGFGKKLKWRIFGLLLMPFTIHPQSLFLKCWLVFRMLSLVTMGVFFPMSFGFAPTRNWLINSNIVIMEFSAYLEMYLFLHVAYYNEEGLLVTHPKLTALHYAKHGFAMDLIAALPYYKMIPRIYKQVDNLDPKIAHLVNSKLFSFWRGVNLLQYHRLIGFLTYLQGGILSKRNLYSFLIILPFLMLVLLIFTTMCVTGCRYRFFEHTKPEWEWLPKMTLIDHAKNITYHGYLYCVDADWIIRTEHGIPVPTPIMNIMVSYYWFLDMLTMLGMGDYSPNREMGLYGNFVTAFFGICFYAYNISFINGEIGRRSNIFFYYQQKIRELLDFLKKEGLNETKINKIFHYFEYVWKRTNGMEKKEMMGDLNSALKGDISLFLYEKTLREVSLFRRIARPYLRVLSKSLTEEYFLRGDTLIRYSDVHNSVFIVMRGTVDVLTQYNEVIASIEPGGIFGNIHQAPPGCSSVTFVASRNVDALKMTSKTLFLLARDYPAIKTILDNFLGNVGDYILPIEGRRLQAVGSEMSMSQGEQFGQMKLYIEFYVFLDYSSYYSLDESELLSKMYKIADKSEPQSTEKGTEGQPPPDARLDTTRIPVPKNEFLACLLFVQPKNWFRFALEPDHLMFRYVWYCTYIGSCVHVVLIPYLFASKDFNPLFFYASLICEPIYYCRIFYILHEAFLDNYGKYVKRFKYILRHYLRDRKRVAWDVLPNIPFYVICIFFGSERRYFVFNLLRLYHLLRWKYILQTFAAWEKPLMARRASILLRKIFIWYFIAIHYSTIIVFLSFSHYGDFSESTRLYLRSCTQGEAYIICMYYVTYFFALTGNGEIYPENTFEYTLTIALIFFSQIVSVILIVYATTLLQILSLEVLDYEHKVMQLKKFMLNQGISVHLMDKLWLYVKMMWSEEKGLHMPELLAKAPYVMKCEIMTEIYSSHIRNARLFRGINESLLSQICGQLNRIVFFKGNYIVQNGDTNACMYWIHRGQVSVLTVHPNLTETRHELLDEHDMFGLAPGLNYGMAHKYSYRAETQCEILVLNLEDWEYILQQFPEDKDLIYRRMSHSYTLF